MLTLHNCYEMDSNYNHAPYFTNYISQNAWFNSKKLLTIEENSYQRKNNNVKVPYSLEELKFCNYVIATNQQDNTKYFYFIIDKYYINQNTSELILKLDVLQTYMFDLNFGDCLIEREHCKRWDNGKPIQYTFEDEGLELGEMEIQSITTVYDYSNKGSYIITSSDRLGISSEGRVGKDNIGVEGGGGENYKQGYISTKGLVFLKSYEGFSSIPYNIGDGTNTIGYGVTELYQPSYYNKLVPSCTEKQASEVLGELVYVNFSSLVLDSLLSNGLTKDDIKQCEFDALVSYAYNSGVGGLKGTEIFTMYVNKQSKSLIAEKWKTTNIMVGTEFEQGLRARREVESQMFLGTYNLKQISNVSQGGYVTDNNGYGYIPTQYQ